MSLQYPSNNYKHSAYLLGWVDKTDLQLKNVSCYSESPRSITTEFGRGFFVQLHEIHSDESYAEARAAMVKYVEENEYFCKHWLHLFKSR